GVNAVAVAVGLAGRAAAHAAVAHLFQPAAGVEAEAAVGPVVGLVDADAVALVGEGALRIADAAVHGADAAGAGRADVAAGAAIVSLRVADAAAVAQC